MKSLINSVIAVVVLGTSSVLAQSASVNSPHNYKRPVSQKAPESSTNTLVVSSNERPVPLKLQNNVMSAHNYKRQGSTNFEQEATLVLSTPVIGPAPQNPLMLPNHYKNQFKQAQVEKRVARKAEKTTTETTILGQ
jgi:hypothetical protein